MSLNFFLLSFILGIIAAAPVGPLCILVFNRAARYGVIAGAATGLGAALGDALYCGLALSGVLGSLYQHAVVARWLYFVGGAALTALGIRLMVRRSVSVERVQRARSFSALLGQGFAITMLNPMVALFFMTAGMQLLSYHGGGAASLLAGTAALGVLSGSFLIFFSSSLCGAFFGKHVPRKRVEQLQLATGAILFFCGTIMLVRTLGLSQLFS